MKLNLRKCSQKTRLSSNINPRSDQIKQVPPDIKEMWSSQLCQPTPKTEWIWISLLSPSLTNFAHLNMLGNVVSIEICQKKYKAKTRLHIGSSTEFYTFILTENEEIEAGFPFESFIKGRSKCAKLLNDQKYLNWLLWRAIVIWCKSDCYTELLWSQIKNKVNTWINKKRTTDGILTCC